MDKHGLISALRIAQSLVALNPQVNQNSPGFREFNIGIENLITELHGSGTPIPSYTTIHWQISDSTPRIKSN